MTLPANTRISPQRLHEGRYIIGPDEAFRILNTNSYAGQRPLLDTHIEVLANSMRAGTFAGGTQLSFARLPDGRLDLINGYHRLSAVGRANVPIEFVVTIHDCADEQEIGTLYFRFDTVLRKRTTNDAIRSTGAAAANDMCSDADAKHVIAAVKVIGCDFRSLSGNPKARHFADPDVVFARANSWWDAGRTYLSLINSADKTLKDRLKRQGVMAVGMRTVESQLETARDFWGSVAEDDGLPKRDPRHSLVRYLRELNKVDNRMTHQVRAVAACWNAFYDKRDLLLVRVDVDKPLVIKGTPIGRNLTKKK